MESKSLTMGLPAGVVVTGSATPMSVMHNGNSDAPAPATSAPAPATAPAPAPISHAPMIATPVQAAPPSVPPAHISTPNAVPPLATMPPPGPAPPTSSPFFSTPPPYMQPNAMSTAIVPVSTGGFAALGLDSMKKKRGRPRKYGPDGSSLALSVTPLLALSPSSLSPSQKRGRGRPLGSGKHQQLAALGELMLGSVGAGFTPHAITVATGEDIASRIMSFSQQGPRGICILSANGAISSVTLRQPSISGGIITYEGRFEILSLSGSFLLTDFGGARTRTGGLSVSLAGPDGRVVGGGVAGVLIAASPVQVIVGSFLSNAKRYLPKPPKTAPAMNSIKTPPNEGATKPATMNVTKPLATPLPNEGEAKPATMNEAKPLMPPSAGKVGTNAALTNKESESKPVGMENAQVAEKGTKGGISASSDNVSSEVQQAMPSINTSQQATMPPPTITLSQPASQMVSEEKHLDHKIPLPG